MARHGMMRCDWCGFSFHENEMVEVTIPGPEPTKKERVKAEEPDLFGGL